MLPSRTVVGIALLGLLLVTLTLAGCDKRIHGKYTGSEGGQTWTVEFHGGGKCTLTMSHEGGSTETTEGTYIEHDNTVTIDAGGMPMPFTLDGDTLLGPMGIKLVRT